MVLQVLADTRQAMQDRDAHRGKVVGRADAREHQELGRLDRACGHHDLAQGGDGVGLAVDAVFDLHRFILIN